MALDFDGVNECMNLPTLMAVVQNRAAISFAAWIRPGSVPGGNRNIIGYAINNGGVPTSDTRAAFQVDPTNRPMKVAVRAPDSGALVNGTSNDFMWAVDTWDHVIGISDVTNDNCQFYKNGVDHGNPATAYTNATTDNTTSANGAMSAEENGASGFYDGVSDDVMVWSRELTANEALTVFTLKGAGTCYFGLQSRYQMKLGAGATQSIDLPDAGAQQQAASPANTPSGFDGIIRYRRRLA